MDYIIWELPISVLSQIIHARLYFDGVKVRRGASANKKELGELEALLGIS